MPLAYDAHEPIHKQPMTASPKHLTVLLVDDGPPIADTLSHFLGRGYTALTADRRSDAIDLLRQPTAQPLRSLGTDRLQPIECFLDLYSQQTGFAPFKLGEQAIEQPLAHPSPGNVGELRNIAIRPITKHAGKTLPSCDVERALDMAGAPSLASTAPTIQTERVTYALQESKSQHEFSLDATLRYREKACIEATRQLANDNPSQAARLLGINRTTPYSRIDTPGRAKRPSAMTRSDT